MEKGCKTCRFHLTGKCCDCCWPNRAGDAPSKWQPKEGTMKYKVLKEISLLTLAQAGPKGCGEFRGEWHSLAIHMSKKGYTHEWTIPAGCTDGAVDDLIQWINDKPMRGKFGIEKGFIEKVDPPFEPVTITLSSQEMVDKAYALLRYNPILCAVGDDIHDPLWKVWKAQLGPYTKNDKFYFNKLRNAWNRRA